MEAEFSAKRLKIFASFFYFPARIHQLPELSIKTLFYTKKLLTKQILPIFNLGNIILLSRKLAKQKGEKNMENIEENIRDDGNDRLEKLVAEMEERGIEKSAKEFKSKLLSLLNSVEDEDGLGGIERIERDLEIIFKDQNEKTFLEVLCDEIQKVRRKITEFNDLQIKPYRTLLIKSLPPDTRKFDYEQKENWNKKEKAGWTGDVIQDKKIVIEKIKEARNTAEECLMGIKFIKNCNSKTYTCSEIMDLNVIQKEMAELNDVFDEYAKLLKEKIIKIEKQK